MIAALSALGSSVAAFLAGWYVARKKYQVKRLQAESRGLSTALKKLEKINELSEAYSRNTHLVRGRTVPVSELNQLLNAND